MNKNIIKWLERNNYKYEIDIYGGDYFTNADPVYINAPRVEVDALNQATINRIYKYCKKYGYIVKYDRLIYPYRYLVIFTAAENAANDLYFTYRDKCINKCELLMHKYYTEPLTIDLNYELHKIMTYYGLQYNTAKIESKTA